MYNKIHTNYNPFFLVPFILWVIGGAVLLKLYDARTLFFAVNGHYSDGGNILMYYTTWIGEGIVITVILISLLLLVRSLRNWWFFLTALLCTVVPTLISQWIKYYHNVSRPLGMYEKATWIHIIPAWPHLIKNSFPSGHTTGAFSMLCFLSMLLPLRYRWLGLCFFVIALSVAYSRMYLAAHFFADVYAGSILGSIAALIIFTIMNHYKPRFFRKVAVSSSKPNNA
ncbi:MAG: phosphatase PAP2 family protein [Taibaiella sp.]|nr:phosphatase PAP2 family protein [Taibaiella sp.]